MDVCVCVNITRKLIFKHLHVIIFRNKHYFTYLMYVYLFRLIFRFLLKNLKQRQCALTHIFRNNILLYELVLWHLFLGI